MLLEDVLNTDVQRWSMIGNAALLQRFVLRNGKPYAPRKRIGRRGTPKQCFANAAKIVMRKARVDHLPNGWGYVEGFAIRRTSPIMAFHHAWVTTDQQTAMDVTLPNADDFEYFGVEFDKPTLERETKRNGVFGLLDPGYGFNIELMFEIDPKLRAIVEAVKPHPAFTKLQEIAQEQAE